jgi:hypothetical protein
VLSLGPVFIIYTIFRIGPLIHVLMVSQDNFPLRIITYQGDTDAREFIRPNEKWWEIVNKITRNFGFVSLIFTLL